MICRGKTKQKTKEENYFSMRNLEISKSIDWITFSFDCVPTSLFLWKDGHEARHTKIPHYESLITWHEGITLLLSDSKVQGNLAQITGRGMSALRKSGLTDFQILEHVAHNARNVTRLDYAIDCVGSPAKIKDIVRAVNKDKVKRLGQKQVIHTAARKNARGETLYIGSRESDWHMRIYDKASQSKIMGVTWTRLEAELKNKLAKKAAHDVCTTGVITQLDSMITSRFDARESVKWFNHAISETVKLAKTPDVRNKDGWKIYMEQFKRSLEKRIMLGQNLEEIAEFRQWLNGQDLSEFCYW